VTEFPAVVMDIFPTIAEVAGLGEDTTLLPQDGISLVRLLEKEIGPREKPIPFQCFGNTVLLDNNMKLLHVGKGKGKNAPKQYELYDLSDDPHETNNVYAERPKVAKKMTIEMDKLKESIAESYAGKDYTGGKLLPGDPEPRFWMQVDKYKPYFDAWVKRPEYEKRIKRGR